MLEPALSWWLLPQQPALTGWKLLSWENFLNFDDKFLSYQLKKEDKSLCRVPNSELTPKIQGFKSGWHSKMWNLRTFLRHKCVTAQWVFFLSLEKGRILNIDGLSWKWVLIRKLMLISFECCNFYYQCQLRRININ